MTLDASAAFFLALNAVLILLLPRQWVLVPFLLGTCYMTTAQGLLIGPFHFTVLRLLIAVGFARLVLRERMVLKELNAIDFLMLSWAGWLILVGIFRDDMNISIIFRLGLVYDACGIYFLMRIFYDSIDQLKKLIIVLVILLSPIALEMISEHITNYNMFSALGGVPSSPDIREGNIRAQGPFRHAILAGTVGGVCLPLMMGIWASHRKTAIMGMIACITIVFCSSSSGPIASAVAGVVGLFFWRFRDRMKIIKWGAVVGYIALDIIMKAPAYYLLSRLPLVAGSTGWHRSRLIESSIEHISEWWLLGTDYTRHWMPTGVSWNPNHSDITNHYLQMGVLGGLPLMVLFIIILGKAFSSVGQIIKEPEGLKSNDKFLAWAMGASLFANTATMISVSYFDQSFVFLYFTLAAIGSMWSSVFKKDHIEQSSNSTKIMVNQNA